MGRGFSVTKEPKVQAFILIDEENGHNYTMNVIDTPGLKETRIEGESRGDEEIINLAQQCISNQITKLNVVIYVAVAGRTHQLDAEAFDTVRRFLGLEFSENSMLVLSHCEQIGKPRIDQIIADMKKFEKTKEILEYCKLGVYPYGTINYDNLCNEEEEEESSEGKSEVMINLVKKRLTKIERMRKDLLQAILKMAEKPRPISQLEDVLSFLTEQKQQAISKALEKEKINWDKELRAQIDEYESRFKLMQEDEFRRFETQLTKQREDERKSYEKRLEDQSKLDQEEYSKRLKEEQEKDRQNFLEQIKGLKEEERQAESRRHAAQLEEDRKLRERLYAETLLRQRQEDDRRFQEQQQHIAEEKRRTWRAEQEAEATRRKLEEKERILQSNDKKCSIM